MADRDHSWHIALDGLRRWFQRRELSEFSPDKLDFVLYTRDTLNLIRSFVPDTEGMPAVVLEAAGLAVGDSLEMSDHLPLVVDFEPRQRE